MNYKLELKQIVEFPRCRIYRDFIQTLITTKSIRTTGGSFLFYYLVLCSYANYRTSYRRMEHITYEILDKLAHHITNISYRTYYRKRRAAIEALSTILWGFTAKETLDTLNKFFPE